MSIEEDAAVTGLLDRLYAEDPTRGRRATLCREAAVEIVKMERWLTATQKYLERHCGGVGGVELGSLGVEDVERAAKCDNGQPFCEYCLAEEEADT